LPIRNDNMASSSRNPNIITTPNTLEESWSLLREGTDSMMNKPAEGMSSAKYMQLYTIIYNYCTSSKLNSEPLQMASALNKTGANLMGADLYKCLHQYFVEHVKGICQASIELEGEKFLQYYTEKWERFTTGASFVNRLFTYLNRHWIKREKDEGRKNVHSVYTLALVNWKENFFVDLQKHNKLTLAVLSLIENQRNNEVIDPNLVKRAVGSFVSLGLDESDSNRQNLDVYKESFEGPFLKETERYYRVESEAFIAKTSIPEYMQKAEMRLKEEENRVDMYLHLSSRRMLVTTCETVLVKEHAELLQEEFMRLLENQKESDLSRMHGLLGRIPEGLDPLRAQFEVATKASGISEISRIAGDKPDSVEPKAYVDGILGVYTKYSELVKKSFRGEAGFNAALDKACREFINTNAVTGKSSQKSPELLAKYSDQLLKKTNKVGEETDLNQSLLQTMTVFKYIEAKDVFQKFYSKMLAKRLVFFQSASDDAEASMISRLKDQCGYTIILRRCNGCFLFKERMTQTHDASDLSVDFHALALATGSWPLQAPTTGLTIPIELAPTYERFSLYYQNKHSGRKLTWLWQLSRMELKTNYTKTKYTFMVSSYQGAILLQFNVGGDSLSFSEISTGTGLDDPTLKPTLALLVKQKVLTQDDDTYDLNLEFKSKKIRVSLNAPVKAEQKAESADVMKTVDEDRKLLIQAVIVRIMKSRKTLKHQALIQESIGQLASRFKPSVVDIKKAIEVLIEKEYVQRQKDSRDVFEYVKKKKKRMPNQHHRAHIPTSTTTTTTTTTTEAPPLTARSIQPQQPSGTLADLTACLRSTTGEIPPPLVGASITVLGTSIYVFGGRLVPTRLMISDMYRLDLNTLEWQKIWPEPSLGLRSDSKGKAKATESDLITQDPSSESTTTTTNEIQTPVIIPPRAPHPRYFHSAEAWGHKLVIFGGMGYAATPNKIHTQPTDSNHQPTESELGLCVLDDLVIFDSITRTWSFPTTSPAQQIAMPSPRYAHLSCLTSETGYDLPINNNQGQDISNRYIGEINVLDLDSMQWIEGRRWERHCGTYRSVACTAPLTVRQGDRLDGSDNPDHDEDRLRRLSWSEKPSVERPEPVYLYSNFNFNDVRRDLELISYPTTPPPPPASPSSTGHYTTIHPLSHTMTGVLPNGLRFPTGAMVGNHMIISGTSLNQEKLRDQTDCFAIWALDLSQANHKHVPIKVPHGQRPDISTYNNTQFGAGKVVWQRIDPGRIMMSGSWNRAVGWGNCLVILGNKDRDIVDDYHHRQINFVDLAFIDLEPFAIYQPPFSNQSYVPHGFSRETSLKSARLGLSLLSNVHLSDFEIVCVDGTVIPLNKRMLEDRWPWFRERLNEFKLKATKVNVAYQKQIQEFCQSSKTIINNSNKSTTNNNN
ncbi:hypothetical protein PSHT_14120, partial [Puccinia striiformis]